VCTRFLHLTCITYRPAGTAPGQGAHLTRPHNPPAQLARPTELAELDNNVFKEQKHMTKAARRKIISVAHKRGPTLSHKARRPAALHVLPLLPPLPHRSAQRVGRAKGGAGAHSGQQLRRLRPPASRTSQPPVVTSRSQARRPPASYTRRAPPAARTATHKRVYTHAHGANPYGGHDVDSAQQQATDT
jgi:hypothetical protein